MTIVARPEPAGARKAAHAALAQRMHWARIMPSLRGKPQIGAPIPLYRISAASVACDGGLTRARRIGWRLPIVGGETEALLNLLAQQGVPRYAGITEGIIPRRLVLAAATAEGQLHRLAERFEPRLLELPALRLYALWLHARSGKSRFIPLSHEHLAEPKLHSEAAFQSFVRRAAGSKPVHKKGTSHSKPNRPAAKAPSR